MSDLGGRFQCMGRLRYGSSSPGTPGGHCWGWSVSGVHAQAWGSQSVGRGHLQCSPLLLVLTHRGVSF